MAAGHLDAALYLLYICNRHNPRDHRYGNPLFPDPVQIAVENTVVKKHLGGNKIAAGLHLLL